MNHKRFNRFSFGFFKGKTIEPFVIHANNPEVRDQIIAKLKEHDPSLTDVFSMPLTAVVGAHAGPKTIGLGYYEVQETA